MNHATMIERLRCHDIALKAGGKDIACEIMNPKPEKTNECDWITKWPIEVYRSDKAIEVFVDGKTDRTPIPFLIKNRTYAIYVKIPMNDVQDDSPGRSYKKDYSFENMKEFLENQEKLIFMDVFGYSKYHIIEKLDGQDTECAKIEFNDSGKPKMDYLVSDADIQRIIKDLSDDKKFIMLDRMPWEIEQDSNFCEKTLNIYFYRRFAFATIPKDYVICTEKEEVINEEYRTIAKHT